MKVPVVHIITLLELGGAQQNTLYTVSHLDCVNFQPFLIAGPGGILDPKARQLADVPVHFVQDLVREIRPLKDLLAFLALRRKLQTIIRANPEKPIVVHTHSSKAGILGRWAAWSLGVKPIIHTFHGFGFNRWQKIPVRIAYQLAERITSRITDAFIMVSQANLREARDLGITDGKKVDLIRSGIPLEEFRFEPQMRGRVRRELGIPENAFVVTKIACFKPQKAPLDFVKAAKLVAAQEERAFFLMAGDGILRPKVEEAVSIFGLKERFRILGWREDVVQILNDTDVMVLTSLWEGLPRVLPQAMAVGIPAVVTRVDGSPEAIQDGVNGFVVEPRDVEGMAKRVLQLLRDPELRRKMGEEGRKRVQEFDINHMVKKQEELYLGLLKDVLKPKSPALHQ